MGTATLDFGFVPGAIAVTSGSTLQLANLTLQNATSLKQALPTAGVFEYKAADDSFWPSLIFEPNSLVRQVACRAAACVALAGCHRAVQLQAWLLPASSVQEGAGAGAAVSDLMVLTAVCLHLIGDMPRWWHLHSGVIS